MCAGIMQSPHRFDTSCSVDEDLDSLKDINNTLNTISVEENNIQSKNLFWLQKFAKLLCQWKHKIEDNIQLLDEEIIYQTERKNYLKKAIATLRIVTEINTECRWCRSTKLDGDYHDKVEEELEKEKSLVDKANSELSFALREVEEFIEKMKAAKLNLESIWSSKTENYNIECDNINLNQLSSTVMLKFGATRLRDTDVTCNDWEKQIEDNLKLAKELLSESYDTHIIINEHILAGNQRQLREQAQNIDISLTEKKSATENYIRNLETQLKSTINKQNETEIMIENINHTRKFLKKSLKVTQTRLNNRLQKPLQEQFFDEAHNGLLEENENIHQQKRFLENEILRLEETMKRLLSQRIRLENELQLKMNNSWIDGEQCPKIRILYPSATELSGHQ